MADPAFIQQAIQQYNAAADTTIVVTWTTANLTAGSALVAVCTWGTSDATPSCADGTNGAWTAGPKLFDATNGQGTAIFYFTNNGSTGKPTVTLTLGGSRAHRCFQVSEFGPADTVTQPDAAGPAWRTQNLPATTTDLVASNAIVTVTDNALVYGVTVDVNGVAVAVAGTGFNSRGGWTNVSPGVPSRVEDKTLAVHASTTATFTAGAAGTRALTAVAAIRPVAVAAAVSVSTSWQGIFTRA